MYLKFLVEISSFKILYFKSTRIISKYSYSSSAKAGYHEFTLKAGDYETTHKDDLLACPAIEAEWGSAIISAFYWCSLLSVVRKRSMGLFANSMMIVSQKRLHSLSLELFDVKDRVLGYFMHNFEKYNNCNLGLISEKFIVSSVPRRGHRSKSRIVTLNCEISTCP